MKNYILKPALFFLLMLTLNSCSQNNQETIIEEEIVIPDNLYPSSDLAIATHSDWTKTHYPKRIAEFKANPLETNDLVFIGRNKVEC